MNAKEHYANQLGNFYSWMLSDWKTKESEFREFLISKSLAPKKKNLAIDLGAGNGIQTLALSKLGYQVIAVDFNQQLLSELKENAKLENQSIQIVEADILSVSQFRLEHPSLLVCCGDTLLHLSSKEEIEEFLKSCFDCLNQNGDLLLSFRDYSITLEGDSRFIPVKSDSSRILTCILDFEGDRIRVTDQLLEKQNDVWKLSISSYFKVRLLKEECLVILETIGFQIEWVDFYQRMITILAKKK
ncbi:class I SAM-dependent methyltransferase [Leptospira kanakyensis]|uniref:Class I SAM-dependent methyltransferase n=1 Tax=Leptospira kanakyensis TaxID=2484968 RepID=A0A6N4QF46_9LEPT|nr:class I SAM-dependent methyltransferase [Leptospira kanakyensis]TGK55374.1 class I SAM-dependent methyltransferase [Leptospira kanakyensis]TGK60908.1 class I SAM-dependent methyltransferase [Leptospira kanakyensis]TGK76617.1 class I SAM-dependent methyltransferase [Leptospira kanakyensis]